MRLIKASQFHPITWWAIGLVLASCAGMASSPVALAAIGLGAILIIIIARESAPWSQSLRFYLVTALTVVIIRVLFRIVFNFDSGADGILNLPVVSIKLGWLGQLNLLGNVSAVSFGAAARDGLRMAAIILSIGLANSLANPRRLLKSTPGALYEVAATFVIAINLAPQLIASAKRVKLARSLRRPDRNIGLIAGTVIPVLEDTLEQSIALAANMDARGFGRRGQMSKTEIRLSRLGSLTAVISLTIGAYFLLTLPEPLWAMACFALSLFGLGLTLRISSRAHIKTKYRPEVWRRSDAIALAAAAILMLLFLSGVIR